MQGNLRNLGDSNVFTNPAFGDEYDSGEDQPQPLLTNRSKESFGLAADVYSQPAADAGEQSTYGLADELSSQAGTARSAHRPQSLQPLGDQQQRAWNTVDTGAVYAGAAKPPLSTSRQTSRHRRTESAIAFEGSEPEHIQDALPRRSTSRIGRQRPSVSDDAPELRETRWSADPDESSSQPQWSPQTEALDRDPGSHQQRSGSYGKARAQQHAGDQHSPHHVSGARHQRQQRSSDEEVPMLQQNQATQRTQRSSNEPSDSEDPSSISYQRSDDPPDSHYTTRLWTEGEYRPSSKTRVVHDRASSLSRVESLQRRAYAKKASKLKPSENVPPQHSRQPSKASSHGGKKRHSRSSSAASAHSRSHSRGHSRSQSGLDFAIPAERPKGWSESLLSIRVARSDALQPDLTLTAPVVRLHVVDPQTGEYVKRAMTEGTHFVSGDEQAELLRSAGRPQLMTLGNASDAPQPAILEHIPPLQTAPYDLRTRRERDLIAAWDEELLVNKNANALVQEDALLLFEVLQPATSFKEYELLPSAYVSGHHHIAWAFLCIKGRNDAAMLGKLRLQLHHYDARAVRAASTHGSPAAAFASWHAQHRAAGAKRQLYSCSLHVTVQSVSQPDMQVMVTSPSKGLRPALPAGAGSGWERGSKTFHELWPEGSKYCGDTIDEEYFEEDLGSTESSEAPAAWETEAAVLQHLPLLERAPNEACEVPNTVYCRMAGHPQGCPVVAFSHNGLYLAAAVGEAQHFRIIVYWVHSAKPAASFGVHQDLVYDLSWASDDLSLVSASSDFTARVWEMPEPDSGAGPAEGAEDASRPGVTLQHSCFVYAAALQPATASHSLQVVATGAFDGSLRFWDAVSGQLLRTVKVHSSYVNSLAFNPPGQRLYSGDADGIIQETSTDIQQHANGGDATFMVKSLRRCADLAGEPISSLQMHPSGRKLVAMTKASHLAAVDLKAFTVNHHYPGVRCTDHPLKPAYSADGRYLVSGSQDGRVYLWDVDAATVFRMDHMGIRSQPMYAMSWSPTHHLLAMCSFSPYAPITVYAFDARKPAVPLDKANALPMVSTIGVASRRARRAKANFAKSPGVLPERITPDVVHAMLEELRSSVQAKGVGYRGNRNNKAGQDE